MKTPSANQLRGRNSPYKLTRSIRVENVAFCAMRVLAGYARCGLARLAALPSPSLLTNNNCEQEP